MKLKRGKFYNYARVKIRYLTHSTDDSFLLKEICNLAIYEKKLKINKFTTCCNNLVEKQVNQKFTY